MPGRLVLRRRARRGDHRRHGDRGLVGGLQLVVTGTDEREDAADGEDADREGGTGLGDGAASLGGADPLEPAGGRRLTQGATGGSGASVELGINGIDVGVLVVVHVSSSPAGVWRGRATGRS